MATITTPAATRAIAVTTGQPLHLTADAAVKWSVRTNEGSWTTISASATEIVWETSTSVTNRLTFDRIEIAIGADPDTPDDTLDFNVCEGPVAVLHATDQAPNPAFSEPSFDANLAEDDDPSLGTPWFMPGANRDGFGTLPPERSGEAPGGPANLVQAFRPGLFVDTAGKLGLRTSVLGRVNGLGPVPATAGAYHAGAYFNWDFGRSRTLGLTRIVFEDAAGNVAIVRGDGRRTTFRKVSTVGGVTTFTAAAGLQTTLVRNAGWGAQPWGTSAWGGDVEYVETAPTGREYYYGEDGQLRQVVDRHGQPVYYRYDANARLQKIEAGPAGDASGLVPYLSYDGSGLLARLVLEDASDAANNRVSYFSYDGNRNLTRVVGPESCVTYFEYSGSAPFPLSAVTDPEGFRWEVGFDGNDRLDRVVDARGNEAYFAYDAAAPLTTYRDRVGKATYLAFDAFGSPTRVFNVTEPGDYYAFDGEGGLTSSTNRLGNSWSYELDGRGNRISSTDPLSARSYFAWDGNDSLTKFVDALERTTYLGFDADRNRTEWVDALDQTTYFTWGADGLLATRKDRRGAVTTFTSDGQANLTKVTDALGHATYLAYNSAGEVVEQKDALLRTSTLVRDLKGRVTDQVDPLGNPSYFAYDARCNLVSQTDARFNTTTLAYDGNSNRTLEIDAVGNPTYFSYEAEDRPASVKNARLFETVMGYGSLGLLKTQTDALGGIQQFTYDDAHQLTIQRDELSNASYFAYDATGRLTHQKDALLRETYIGYDLVGNQVKVEAPLEPGEAPGIFWVDSQADTLKRANLDGSGVDTLVSTGLTTPRGIAVDDEGGKIYWTDSGTDTVKRCDLAGTNVETLVTGQATPRGIALDLEAGKVYWTDSGDDVIRRADLDGSNEEQVLSTGASTDPRGIALDVEAGKVYWTDADSGAEKIKRANMADGSGVETLVDTGADLDLPRFLALDLARGKMYWTDSGLDTIKRANLDGTSVETVVSGQSTPAGIALDVIQGKVYWADSGDDRIQRANLDGSNVEELVDTGSSTTIEGLALGLRKRVSVTVYDALDRVSESIDAVAAISKSTFDEEGNVLRSIDPLGNTTYFTYDLDGRQTHVKDALNHVTYVGYDAADQTILQLDQAGFPTYLSYDAAGRQDAVTDAHQNTARTGFDRVGNVIFTVAPGEASGIFWVDSGNDTIKRAELDGTGVTTLVSTGLDLPRGLAVDVGGGKMYWVDSGNDTIKRADLDGTDVETLVSSGLTTPRGIAVDPSGKMYWTDSGSDTIKRADLDGTDVETLVSSGLTTPTGIALDLDAGQMYWVDSGTDTLKRAELDGTSVTTIVSTGLTTPVDVGVDSLRGKLYWIDSGTDKLERADLDGSNREELVTGLSTPRSVAVDVVAQKVYWTDSGTDTISRCNLDGTDVEVVVDSGLATPDGLAVQLPLRFTVSAYDAINRGTTTTDAYGGQTLAVYDAVGNVVRSVDELGFATYMTFDGLDRQVKVKDGVHFAETYMGYDKVSNGVLDVDPLGFAGYYTFDRLNRQVFSHDRAGALAYMEFDVVGNQTGRTVFLGAGGEQRSTYMAYDAANRQVDVTDALGGVAASKFDQAGNTVQVLDQVGRPTYFGFDKLNRQTTRTNALGNTWTTVFNSRGLVSSEADPESRLLEMTYDRLGRTTHRNNSLGEISYFGFDARSNQVVTVNPRGNATYFTFDRLDRTSHREDQLGGVRYFGFDAVGNQVLQLDELGNPTYFFHDGLRRVTRAMDGLFKSTYLEYDSRSSLVKRVSPATTAGTTYMSYDPAGRLEQQWFAAPSSADTPIYYQYDQVSNLTSADDSLAGIGVTTNEFDKLDRLTKKHNLGGAVYYQYDASSQRIELKNPDRVKTNYVIDAAGRTWQVSMSGPEGVTRSYYVYDDAGLQTKKVLPSNAVISYYHYDNAARLETLKNLDSSLTVINYFHYDRNENGAIERIQHEGGKWTYYAFDALDRLTDERQHTNPQVYRKTYVYDAASNRTTKAETISPSPEVFTFYDYNAANLLEQERIGSTSANYFAYDDAQRMNALWTSGSEATYFDHNQRDQISALRFEGTGDTDHSWDYTGTGERVRMVGGQGGTTATFLAYDGDRLLTERDEFDFVYGSYRPSRQGDPYGDLIGGEDQEAGALLYPTFDQWNSVRTLEGVSGSAEFDFYGVTVSNDLASSLRVGFDVPMFVGLNTTRNAYLALNGLYLPASPCLTGVLFCPVESVRAEDKVKGRPPRGVKLKQPPLNPSAPKNDPTLQRTPLWAHRDLRNEETKEMGKALKLFAERQAARTQGEVVELQGLPPLRAKLQSMKARGKCVSALYFVVHSGNTMQIGETVLVSIRAWKGYKVVSPESLGYLVGPYLCRPEGILFNTGCLLAGSGDGPEIIQRVSAAANAPFFAGNVTVEISATRAGGITWKWKPEENPDGLGRFWVRVPGCNSLKQTTIEETAALASAIRKNPKAIPRKARDIVKRIQPRAGRSTVTRILDRIFDR